MFLLILLVTMGIGLLATWRVRSNFARFSRVEASSGLTGAEAAQRILHASGIADVEVVPVHGTLTDHYDPTNKRLALSEAVYGSRSIAALGVAAHECGHALQHSTGYAPLHARMALVKSQGIATSMVMWLPLLAAFFHFISPRTVFFLLAIGWGAIMLFNLITLPVEFDASNRAEEVLGRLGITRTQEEAGGVHTVLRADGWTYVAAFITSLVYFLWYLLPLLGGRRN
jgi:Zn-dependent membrane protease YugP